MEHDDPLAIAVNIDAQTTWMERVSDEQYG